LPSEKSINRDTSLNELPFDVDDIFGAASQTKAKRPVSAASPKDARKDVRVKVKWAARVQLPSGAVVEMRVCDISDGGIGLAGEVGIPPNSVLTCAIALPDLDDPKQIATIVGTIKTTHATIRGLDLIYGGTWVHKDASAQDLIKRWIRRLRG
jgi:hypothetical protein